MAHAGLSRHLLRALAFDDLVVAIGTAAENAGGFPRCAQHFRRSDFKIVVQLTRLGQIKPLDDVNVAIVWNAEPPRSARYRPAARSPWCRRPAHRPPFGRSTVQRQVRVLRVPTAVDVNPPHAVAVDLAQPGDAARRSGEVNHSISQTATYCFNSLLSCSLSRGGAQFFTPPPRTPPIVGAPWNHRLAKSSNPRQPTREWATTRPPPDRRAENAACRHRRRRRHAQCGSRKIQAAPPAPKSS